VQVARIRVALVFCFPLLRGLKFKGSIVSAGPTRSPRLVSYPSDQPTSSLVPPHPLATTPTTMSEPSRLQPRTLIAATAAIAAAITATSILGSQAIRRRLRTAELKRQVEAELKGQEWADTSALGNGAEDEEGDKTPLVYSQPGKAGYGEEKVWAKGEYDEELIREQVRPFAVFDPVVVLIADMHNTTNLSLQLSRNYTFLGEEGMQKVRDSYVVVVRPRYSSTSGPRTYPIHDL
jgi:hypothetical protein